MNTEPVQVSSTLDQALVPRPHGPVLIQEKRRGALTRWQEKNREKRAQAVSDGERFNLFVYLIYSLYPNDESEANRAATDSNPEELALTTLGLVGLPLWIPLKFSWWLITTIPKVPGKILNRIWYGE